MPAGLQGTGATPSVGGGIVNLGWERTTGDIHEAPTQHRLNHPVLTAGADEGAICKQAP